MIEFKGSWEDYLHLVEFSYNNSYKASIKMDPFESLYGRKCRSPICWDEVGERRLLGPNILVQITDKVRVIRDYSGQYRADRRVGLTLTEGRWNSEWVIIYF